MREILFRGRGTRGDKKWIEGDLFHGYNGYVGITKKLLGSKTWQVEPETVGQYTGLTDKNGKKIFEGDIVDVNNALLSGRFWVEYGMSGGAFIVKDKGDRRYFLGGCNCTVIGNIYDNPELLKLGGV